jgi:GNAT superfamily N-acetyltransferase
MALVSDDVTGREDVAQCRVRSRGDDDMSECVRVLARVHEHDGYPMRWPDSPAIWLAPVDQLAAWVAELNGEIIGHIVLSRSSAGDLAPELWSRLTRASVGDSGVISRLFVAPGARGRNVGSLLMAEALRDARERGLHAVLDVVATDSAAIVLYERLGWTHLGQVDQQWGKDQNVIVHCYAALI